MPPPYPYTLSGYDNVSSDVVIESFDSNYKLFKDVNGEVFARYIRTNCRNGSPLKKIWVPKSLLEKLRVNVMTTSLKKKTNPRSISSRIQRLSYDHSNKSVSQGRTQMTHEYVHNGMNRYVHPTKNFSAYSFEYTNPPVKHAIRATLPRFSDAALRLIASKPPLRMWVVKNN